MPARLGLGLRLGLPAMPPSPRTALPLPSRGSTPASCLPLPSQGCWCMPDDELARVTAHAAQLSGTLAPRQAPAQREYLAELYARAAQDGAPPSA